MEHANKATLQQAPQHQEKGDRASEDATAAFADQRLAASAQLRLTDVMDRSPRAAAMKALRAGINQSPVAITQNEMFGRFRAFTPAVRRPGMTSSGTSPVQRFAGTVVQLAYDDTAQITVDRDALSGIWRKLKANAKGGADFPNFGDVFDHLSALLDRSMTERALAEQVSRIPAIREILLDPRRKSLEAPSSSTETLKVATKRAVRATVYFHATLSENVDAIFRDGLTIGKAGKGAGVSTHARSDDRGGTDAQATYNKWSSGHVFITPDKSEAVGYRDKMKEKSGKEAKVIHIFADPDWMQSEGLVDVDSKAGLKTDGDMTLIGDGASLNPRALRLITAIVSRIKGAAPAADVVTAAYLSVVG